MLIPIVIIITMCFVHLPTAIIMIVTAPFIPLFYVILDLKQEMSQGSNNIFKPV